MEKKITKSIEDRASDVHVDLGKECKNRIESIEHIKQCLKSDFPKLEEMIRKEQEDREDGDQQLDLHLTQEI